MRGGAAGAGKRGMAAQAGALSRAAGAVKNTHLRAERSRARRPRKRRSRFVRGFCNAGAAAACARASVQAACALGPAPLGRRCTCGLGPATARAFSLPPLPLPEFFFGGWVCRVVHERLRALVPALGGD